MVSTRRLLTLQEVADELAVSYWTVRRWAHEGKMPYVRLPGGFMRIRPQDLAMLKATQSESRRESVPVAV